MSNEQWWAAERKAAEFWRKIKEQQMRYHARNSLNHDYGAAPIARPRVSAEGTNQVGLREHRLNADALANRV